MPQTILHPLLPDFESIVAQPDLVVFSVGIAGPHCTPDGRKILPYFGEFNVEGYSRIQVRARHILIDPVGRKTITANLAFGPFRQAAGVPTHAMIFIGADGVAVHVFAELVPDPTTNPHLDSCIARNGVNLPAGTLWWR
jgi:hypothetical protein